MISGCIIFVATLHTHSPLSLASSTSTISSSSCLGDLSMTLWTVRSSVVHASLWNTITTLVRGRSSGYNFVLHLKKTHTEPIRLRKRDVNDYILWNSLPSRAQTHTVWRAAESSMRWEEISTYPKHTGGYEAAVSGELLKRLWTHLIQCEEL